MSGFKFPDCYKYPPFWTLQVNPEQKAKQIELWSNLICAYMKSQDLYEFDISAAQEMPLFSNEKINRTLPKIALVAILDEMVKAGNAEWLNEMKSRVRIIWRTLEQWGNIFYKWAVESGQCGTMFTIHELREDSVSSEEFHMMNPEIMVQALKHLEAKGKAKFFQRPSIDECGVKFIE